MNYRNKLIKVKGKHLDRFIEEVRKLRAEPNIDQDWKSFTKEKRESRIAALLSFQNFSEKELQDICKVVFKIRIPYRLIIVSLAVLMLAYLLLEYRRYQLLPRIYSVGNQIPAYASSDTTQILYHLNIYGEEIKQKGTSSSPFSMMQVAEENGMYVVKSDNFFNALLRKGRKVYISKEGVVTTATDYNEYKRILRELKGTSFLPELPVDERKAIHELVKSNKTYFNATIVNSIDNTTPGGYRPFVIVRGPEESILFVCLKTTDGKYANLRLVVRKDILTDIKAVSYLNNEFPLPLLFREERENAQQVFPKIRYRLNDSDTSYVCVAPPYELESFIRENSSRIPQKIAK